MPTQDLTYDIALYISARDAENDEVQADAATRPIRYDAVLPSELLVRPVIGSSTGVAVNEGRESSQLLFRWLVAKPLIRLSAGPDQDRTFEVLKQWLGEVDEVVDDTIVATLRDADDSAPVESVEFPLAEVSPGDRELAVAGAMFYWTIGYVRSLSGTVRRVSDIRFRRVPVWTAATLDFIRRGATERNPRNQLP